MRHISDKCRKCTSFELAQLQFNSKTFYCHSKHIHNSYIKVRKWQWGILKHSLLVPQVDVDVILKCHMASQNLKGFIWRRHYFWHWSFYEQVQLFFLFWNLHCFINKYKGFFMYFGTLSFIACIPFQVGMRTPSTTLRCPCSAKWKTPLTTSRVAKRLLLHLLLCQSLNLLSHG